MADSVLLPRAGLYLVAFSIALTAVGGESFLSLDLLPEDWKQDPKCRSGVQYLSQLLDPLVAPIGMDQLSSGFCSGLEDMEEDCNGWSRDSWARVVSLVGDLLPHLPRSLCSFLPEPPAMAEFLEKSLRLKTLADMKEHLRDDFCEACIRLSTGAQLFVKSKGLHWLTPDPKAWSAEGTGILCQNLFGSQCHPKTFQNSEKSNMTEVLNCVLCTGCKTVMTVALYGVIGNTLYEQDVQRFWQDKLCPYVNKTAEIFRIPQNITELLSGACNEVVNSLPDIQLGLEYFLHPDATCTLDTHICRENLPSDIIPCLCAALPDKRPDWWLPQLWPFGLFDKLC